MFAWERCFTSASARPGQEGRVGWVVSAAVDAFGGDVRAYAVSLLRQGLYYEELEARLSMGCVRLIATDATAMSIEGAFWAASSRAAELLVEGAPSSGGGRPSRTDWADVVEEQDAVLNEIEGVCWGHLDHQGRGELGDTVPGSEGAGTADGDVSIAPAMAFWRAGSEGRAEIGTQFIRRESEAEVAQKASQGVRERL